MCICSNSILNALGEGEAAECRVLWVGKVLGAVVCVLCTICICVIRTGQSFAICIRLPSPRRCRVKENQRATLHAVRERGWG